LSNNYISGAGAREAATHPGISVSATDVPRALIPLMALAHACSEHWTKLHGSFDFEEMITSLRDLFTHDRQVASQADNRRCGICYLYFITNELRYREEEGFYVCSGCERSLGKQTLPMVRYQQK